MSKHTPGLLRVKLNARDVETIAPYCGERPVVAHCLTLEDAEHVVACWNACKDINPEAVPELLKALKGLLESLGAPVPSAEDGYAVAGEVMAAEDSALAAIAEAEAKS